MIEIDWSRCATVPKDHQRDGVKAVLKRTGLLLAHEVGAGKSKIVVDSGQLLYEDKQIDTIVVCCPAFARGVWADPDPMLGEISKHGWPSVENYITEYSVRFPKALTGTKPVNALHWLITNYEYIRREQRLSPLRKYLANHRYMLVGDEAWALKDDSTEQWAAFNALRQLAARVYLLNGTPIADSPMDLNAQMRLLDPKILGFKYINKRGQEAWSNADWRFRAHYAIMDPNVSFPKIVEWKNLEELREKCAPYVLTKPTRECWDLPPVLDPILVEAPLSDDNWRIYKQMRDDMVAWLDMKSDMTGGTAAVAKQAIVKSMRLAQITSGFVGGIQQIDLEDPEALDFSASGPAGPLVVEPPREIGREKLDYLLRFLERLRPVPERILIWCRFRLEIERAARAFDGTARRMHMLYGQQHIHERQAAVRALNPEYQPDGLNGVVGNPTAGGAALNLAGASLAINLSHDTKLRVFLQARGRIDRPGQKNPIRYVDIVATGPKGQRTIDHHVLAALRGKQDIATWTAATWKSKLMTE